MLQITESGVRQWLFVHGWEHGTGKYCDWYINWRNMGARFNAVLLDGPDGIVFSCVVNSKPLRICQDQDIMWRFPIIVVDRDRIGGARLF